MAALHFLLDLLCGHVQGPPFQCLLRHGFKILPAIRLNWLRVSVLCSENVDSHSPQTSVL